MIEGIYRITFTGTAGSGFGMLVFHLGAIAGADVAGSIYDGSYSVGAAAQTIDFQLVMNAPAGVTPVQTGTPLASPLSLPINGSLTQNDLDGDAPTLLQTPLGPVNVLLTKIRDIP
jgi:hypothetical protein